MKHFLPLLMVILGITFGARGRNGDTKVIHIWIRTDTSAVEIFSYTPAKCISYPNQYCTYLTNTSFPFHTMTDSVFLGFYNAGYFTGQDFNKRYIP